MQKEFIVPENSQDIEKPKHDYDKVQADEIMKATVAGIGLVSGLVLLATISFPILSSLTAISGLIFGVCATVSLLSKGVSMLID